MPSLISFSKILQTIEVRLMGSVVQRICFHSFFENQCDVAPLPVSWHCLSLQRVLKYC